MKAQIKPLEENLTLINSNTTVTKNVNKCTNIKTIHAKTTEFYPKKLRDPSLSTN